MAPSPGTFSNTGYPPARHRAGVPARRGGAVEDGRDRAWWRRHWKRRPRMTTFTGFPPETLRFLQELQANNRRDWLEAHRADYQRLWLAPGRGVTGCGGGGLGGGR